MRFIPENLALNLDKSEVKTIVEYLTIDKEMNKITIKKLIKYGNKIENSMGDIIKKGET